MFKNKPARERERERERERVCGVKASSHEVVTLISHRSQTGSFGFKASD